MGKLRNTSALRGALRLLREKYNSSKIKMVDIAKGKFERTNAENYDEFLKALDVNFLLRKAATASTPTMEVTEADGQWTIKTSTIMKSMELSFKVGNNFLKLRRMVERLILSS